MEYLEALLGETFEIQSMLICPSHLGFPVRRKRRYSVAVRKGLWRWAVDFADEHLSLCASAELVTDASVFFCAPASLLDQKKRELANMRHLPPLQHDGCTWSWSTLLQPGDFRRLSAYMKDMDKKCYFDTHNVAVVNVGQNLSHVGSGGVSDQVPALLRQSPSVLDSQAGSFGTSTPCTS